MGSAFSFAVGAIAPILIYMAVGYALRLLRFANDAFFKGVNRLMFHVFLPVLIFCNLYEIESIGDIRFSSVLYVAVVILLLVGIGFLASLPVKRREQKGVVWQSAFRSNYAILGIPLAESIGGAPALSFASVIAAVSVPSYNLIAAIILSAYAEKGRGREQVKRAALSVIKNPLIIAVALGFVALGIRALLPTGADGTPVFSLARDLAPVYKALSGLGRVASPLALVVLGARFDFGRLGGNLRLLSLCTALRVVVAPLLGLSGAILLTRLGVLQFEAAEYPALIAVCGTPCAVSSAVMVSEIGGDEQLAAQIVVSTSVFSILTIMLSLVALRALGAL